MLWVLICTVHLTVCSYHVTYAFQSAFTLYSCLIVKKLFAQSRCEISILSDCKWTLIHNHLVHKRTLVLWVLICMVHLIVLLAMSHTRFRVNPHSVQSDVTYSQIVILSNTSSRIHTVKFIIQISTHNTAQSFGQFG